jgi:NDP-sugar pyrophosphorylase family protein
MNEAPVVILAGGAGTRLAPYTTVLPKPLMPVGDMPILEVVLRQLRAHGFQNVTISVGHLAELIMAFFGQGSKLRMNIRYAIEDKPLGTIGPLRLISGLDAPFLVMNGDLLTNLDYAALYDHHCQGDNLATVATAQRQVPISLGVLEFDSNRRMTAFHEKPVPSFSVSMGIYMFSPAIVEMIPARRYGFDELMLDMLTAGRNVGVYPFEGKWLDIGRPEDYRLATKEFERSRHLFLPDEHQERPSRAMAHTAL